MANKFSISELERLKKQGNIRDYEEIKKGCNEKGKSKYGNRKVELDGYVFDSVKESKRYIELRYLLRAGEITDLELQKEFELNEGGTHSLKYVADFQYKVCKTGEVITEDCKGFKTVAYKKKRKLMLKLYNIKILET